MMQRKKMMIFSIPVAAMLFEVLLVFVVKKMVLKNLAPWKKRMMVLLMMGAMMTVAVRMAI